MPTVAKLKKSGLLESTIESSLNVSQISSIEGYMSDVPIYESSQSTDEIDEELNKTEEELPLPKKQIQFKDWTFIREYQNSDDAKTAIETEKLWSQCKRIDTVDGTKVYYRCNLVKLRGPQCASSLYLLFKADCDIVLEFRTNSAHTHDDIVDKRGVEKKNALIREVERLIDLGVKPMNIMHDLSKKDEIQLPTKNQLTTIIAAIRKRKFGPATISMGALLQWLKEHSKVPEDIHTAFVLSYEVNMEAKEPYFRFLITTKHLLSQAGLRNFSHADTTYKCIWQGFPVFMVGTTDWNKSYHPYALCVCSNEKEEDFQFVFEGLKNGTNFVLNFTMKQTAIVCDAAFAISNAFLTTFGDDMVVIMCWFHAIKAMEREIERTVNKKNQEKILGDIYYLHIASNTTMFKNGVRLFLLKWNKDEAEFCKYFEKVWITEHPNWFVGAAKYMPCHNNALESSNRYLKDNHTFRIRLPLPQFLKVAVQTVQKWSNQYVIGLKNFALRPTISLELWTNSYNWARSNVVAKIVSKSKEKVIVEVQAEIVRAKSNKRGVSVPLVSSSKSTNQNIEIINLDLEQLVDSEEKKILAKETATARRPMPSQTSKSNSKKTTEVKRRRVAENSAVKRRRIGNRSSETLPSNQERVATKNEIYLEEKEQTSNQTLVPAPKRRRVVTRLSSEKLVAANITAKCPRIISGSIENLSSNQERDTRNGIDLEAKEQSSNQTFVPTAKRRRVVTRSSELKLSSQRLVSVKSSGTPSSQRTGPRKSKRRRVDKWPSESLPSNKEILPLSNEMVNGEVASLMDFNKLSKSISEDFETYKRIFLKWKTTIVKENVLSGSICNCPAFGTEYICKHIVGLAIRMKLITPPPEAKTIPIGEKRKPGRPSKTKPALMIQ